MLEGYNEILSTDEVCEILFIGKNTLYKLLRSEEIIGYRMGKNWKITKQAVINFINKKTVGA